MNRLRSLSPIRFIMGDATDQAQPPMNQNAQGPSASPFSTTMNWQTHGQPLTDPTSGFGPAPPGAAPLSPAGHSLLNARPTLTFIQPTPGGQTSLQGSLPSSLQTISSGMVAARAATYARSDAPRRIDSPNPKRFHMGTPQGRSSVSTPPPRSSPLFPTPQVRPDGDGTETLGANAQLPTPRSAKGQSRSASAHRSGPGRKVSKPINKPAGNARATSKPNSSRKPVF